MSYLSASCESLEKEAAARYGPTPIVARGIRLSKSRQRLSTMVVFVGILRAKGFAVATTPLLPYK